MKGRWPSLPNAGTGLRWTRRHRARDGIAGRNELRRRSQDAGTTGVEAYGEGVWSRYPEAGVKFAVMPASDGGKSVRLTGEITYKP